MDEKYTDPTYIDQLKMNIRRGWYGFCAGAGIVGAGVSVEILEWRSEAIGITSIVGGLAVMATVLPIKRLDRYNDMLPTYQEIQSLPEVDDFTGAG
jgi:hypothetical protein